MVLHVNVFHLEKCNLTTSSDAQPPSQCDDTGAANAEPNLALVRGEAAVFSEEPLKMPILSRDESVLLA